MTLGEAIEHPRWREFGEYMVARGMLLGMNGMMRFGIASYSFKNYINGERYCADTLQFLYHQDWSKRKNNRRQYPPEIDNG